MSKKKNGHGNNATTISVVLDRSGSMMACKAATIEGFNGFLAEQAKLPGARFSLTQFDSQGIDHLYVDQPVEKVKPLDESSYEPRGGTPLYDAVGLSVRKLDELGPKGKVVFVIITDGQENDSREFTHKAIFDLVAEKRVAGWEFVFIGANVDAYATSAGLGIAADSTHQYESTPEGTLAAFYAVSKSTTAYRSGATASMVMPSGQSGGPGKGRKTNSPLDAERPSNEAGGTADNSPRASRSSGSLSY